MFVSEFISKIDCKIKKKKKLLNNIILYFDIDEISVERFRRVFWISFSSFFFFFGRWAYIASRRSPRRKVFRSRRWFTAFPRRGRRPVDRRPTPFGCSGTHNTRVLYNNKLGVYGNRTRLVLSRRGRFSALAITPHLCRPKLPTRYYTAIIINNNILLRRRGRPHPTEAFLFLHITHNAHIAAAVVGSC